MNSNYGIQQETGFKCNSADIVLQESIVGSAHVSGGKTHKGQIKKTDKIQNITLLVLRLLRQLI